MRAASWLCVGVIVMYSIGYCFTGSGTVALRPAVAVGLSREAAHLQKPASADPMPALTILAIVSPDVRQQVEQWRGWMAAMQQRDPGTIYRVKVLYTEQSTPLHTGFGTDYYRSLIKLRAAALASYVRDQVGNNQEPIIFTGLDVVPLRPYSALLPSLDHQDLSFSKEFYGSASGFVNWDFFIFRPEPEVALLFEDVAGSITDYLWSDQLVGNRLLWGWQADTIESTIPASTLTEVGNIREGLRWAHLDVLVIGQALACIRHSTVAFHANGAGGKLRKITIVQQIVMSWQASDCYDHQRLLDFDRAPSSAATLFVCQDLCSASDVCTGVMYNQYEECYLQTSSYLQTRRSAAMVPDLANYCTTVVCLRHDAVAKMSPHKNLLSWLEASRAKQRKVAENKATDAKEKSQH